MKQSSISGYPAGASGSWLFSYKTPAGGQQGEQVEVFYLSLVTATSKPYGPGNSLILYKLLIGRKVLGSLCVRTFWREMQVEFLPPAVGGISYWPLKDGALCGMAFIHWARHIVDSDGTIRSEVSFFKKKLIFCVWVFCLHVQSAPHVCSVLRDCQIPWNWSSTGL